MVLRKTTILPTDDPAEAQRMLREWIEQQPQVLWITFGNDADAKLTAERGDATAGTLDDARWCVWARDRAAVEPVISGLGHGTFKRPQVASARAITLSRDDDIRDVLPASKPVPNFTRSVAAWIRAEV